MRKLTKRAVALVAGSVLAVAGGTAAFAYASGWFKGDSKVTATSADIKNLHVEASLGNTHLWPGKTVGVPAASVKNDNEYPVVLTGITNVAVSSKNEGCGTGQAQLSFAPLPANQVLSAGEAKDVSLGKITMAKTASAVCANADFTITATLTGEIYESAVAPANPGA